MSNELDRVQVRWLATHQNPDLDDVEAVRILLRWGESKFPGISGAEVITTGSRTPRNKKAEALEGDGILCVGIGGGIFDEHPFEEHPCREGECATTLVAKFLGVESNPALKKNIAYSLLRNFSAKGTHEWEIAPLIKLAFRYGVNGEDAASDQGKASEKVFVASFLLLDTAEKNEEFVMGGTQPTLRAFVSMDELVALWLIATFTSDGKTLFNQCRQVASASGESLSLVVAKTVGREEDATIRQILEYARENQEADIYSNETSFKLAQLVCHAQRQGRNLRAIQQVVGICLTAVWKKNLNFFIDCRNDFERATTRHEIVKHGCREIVITSVVSENPEIAKFCRSRHGSNAMVVIKRDGSGNTQVFFDQRAGKVDPRPIVRALRLAEREANRIKGYLSDETLTSLGSSVEGAEVWYFDGHQILNGSLTAEVEPTRLTRECVEAVVLKTIKKSLGGGARK